MSKRAELPDKVMRVARNTEVVFVRVDGQPYVRITTDEPGVMTIKGYNIYKIEYLDVEDTQLIQKFIEENTK